MSTDFTASNDVKNHGRQKYSQEDNRLITGKIAKWTRKMDVYMTTATFKPSDTCSVLSFRRALRLLVTVIDPTKVPQCCHFHMLFVYSRRPISWHRVTADKKQDYQQEGRPATYCQVAKYWLETYSADNFMVEADAENVNSEKRARVTTARYSEALWEDVLRCGRLYDGSMLHAFFVEGLHSSIRYSIRTYWKAQ